MGKSKIKILEMLKQEIITTEDALELLKLASDEDREETLKILEILEEQTITATEAKALIKQVDGLDSFEAPHTDDDPESHDGHEPEEPHEQREQEKTQDRPGDWDNWEQKIGGARFRPGLGWIDDLRIAVEDAVGNVVENVSFFDDFTFSEQRESFVSSANIVDEIRALVFEGKNSSVKLEGYSGNKVEVDVRYKTKSNWEPRVAFSEENGVFSLNYDDNALRSIGISIRVPQDVKIGGISLKNKNSSISVDDITADKIELSTKNSPIKVSDTKGGILSCDTTNSTISLDDVEVREINAKTSNSRITLDDVTAFQAKLVTSNAKIDVEDSDIAQIFARSSNAPIQFDNLSFDNPEPQRIIDAETSNGSITIDLPYGEYACRLRASTTHGGISSELDNMVYRVNEKSYAEAESYGYETAQNKLSLKLRTSNGGIKIEQ